MANCYRHFMLSQTTIDTLRAFTAEREWEQFHSPENLAKSIVIEGAELLECFQWGSEFDRRAVEDELADVVTYCVHLATTLGVDFDEIVLRKLEQTRAKYPADKVRGSSAKYTEYER